MLRVNSEIWFNGKGGLLTPLIKQLTEAVLQAEQEQHIAYDSGPIAKTISPPKL